MTDQFETEYDFAQKYENKNPIAKYLVNKFYQGVENCVKHTGGGQYHEIGCGEGYSCERIINFLPESSSYSASEIEDRNIESAKERNPDIQIMKESVYELPYEDNSLDNIFLLEVLEHLDDPIKALSEISRVAKNHIIISVPREPLWCAMNLVRGKYITSLGNTPGHIQHWSKTKFIKLISQYGTVEHVESPIPWSIVCFRPNSTSIKK
jgi:ubiquinone/menaquinone biosynthesis C-methylase UbiE